MRLLFKAEFSLVDVILLSVVVQLSQQNPWWMIASIGVGAIMAIERALVT